MYQTGNPRDNAVFTVSELNSRARQLLEVSFASVRVEGEISNLARPSSGHWYFTLKDAGAQVRCAMFRSRTAMLKFLPKEGDMVEIRAKVSLYENRGDYQLIVDSMKPAGEGALLLAFEQLKRRLASEGLFAEERKRPLPAVRRVAIITSPTGAAIHDMLTVLKRRWPSIEVDIYPVMVQGNEAPAQIITALQRANRDARCDVIIAGRGGGSLEDLWCFNDEGVARAIAHSDIPVISAVGHEVDFTIADFVADLRAPTPSAAAEMISPDGALLRQQIISLKQRLQRAFKDRQQQRLKQLEQLRSRLRGPQHQLQNQSQRLDQLEIRLQRVMQQKIAEPRQKLARLTSVLEHLHPQKTLTQHQKNLQQLQQRLKRAVQQQLTQKQKALASGARLLSSVSPLQVLARGYSITHDQDGKVIHSAADVSPGSTIETRLHQGKLISTVQEITPDDSAHS